MWVDIGEEEGVQSLVDNGNDETTREPKWKIQLLSRLLVLILCYKRNGSRFPVLHRVVDAFGKMREHSKMKSSLLSTISCRATLTLLSYSANFARATTTRWSTPYHEPFLKQMCKYYSDKPLSSATMVDYL